jgi:hypothetical protein
VSSENRGNARSYDRCDATFVPCQVCLTSVTLQMWQATYGYQINSSNELQFLFLLTTALFICRLFRNVNDSSVSIGHELGDGTIRV